MKSNLKVALKDYLNPPELRITDTSYVNLDSNWNSKGSLSPYSCLYIVESGEGILVNNGKETIMKKGNAYLIPSGTVFSYSCPHKLTKLFFHFNMIGSDGLDVLRNIQEIVSCNVDESEIKKLVSLYGKTTFSDSLQIRSMILDILSRAIKTASIQPTVFREYSPFIKNVMAYIQENLSLSLALTDIAKTFFIAEVTLRKRFKAETGITPHQYIEDLIFFKAEILLTTKNYTIKEISSSLGFCDQFYFSRRFTARYGIPPQIYRTRLKS